MNHPPRILITPGDPQSIGPEVTLKGLALWLGRKKNRKIHYTVVGYLNPLFSTQLQRLASKFKVGINTVHIRPERPLKTDNLSAKDCGYVSGRAIEVATALALQSPSATALVTGPISKERLRLAGFPYDGHTEFLKDLCGVDGVTMLLHNPYLSAGLVTTHVPLRNVAALITKARIIEHASRLIEHFRRYSNTQKPYLQITGLNPHCGEAGLLGSEEEEIHAAIKLLQKKYKTSAKVVGPVSADTAFAMAYRSKNKPDALLAMYHDQGLGPVKTVDFANTINITCGLPFLRTSVDHGTAFDIAQKNIADPSSMFQAIQAAARAL